MQTLSHFLALGGAQEFKLIGEFLVALFGQECRSHGIVLRKYKHL
jgi:hypothetical protein